MRIVLCYPVENRHLDQIRSAIPAENEVVAAEQQEIAREILDADIFCGHAKVPMPWGEVVERGRLRWIQSSAAGLDHCLVPEVIESGIRVSGASGLFAQQVAEHTMAMLLGHLRSLPTFIRASQKREFIRRPTADMRGKTVGIIGLGSNGRRIAEVLAPFDVRTIATDVFPIDKPPCVEHLWPADHLNELLKRSDIVVLCVPLTAETDGMMNATMFAQMKPGSLLVNVARGRVVVEQDLVECLTAGHLIGAALDVTEIEPLPVESPLWDMPQVLITPHVGAQSATRIDDTTKRVCENLRRYFAGEPLIDEIDKSLGFSRRLPAKASQ